MGTEPSLTVDRLKEVLHYDRRTGFFFWRSDLGRVHKGTRAGCANKKLGYWVIGIDGTRYYAHQLAWLWVFGAFPKKLEFLNGDGFDARIHNLREKRPLIRLAQTKVCPTCQKVFNRHENVSNGQWAARVYCSKKCVEEHKRSARPKSRPCRECSGAGPFRIYTTSSGRKSKSLICRRCFNRLRAPKRRAEHRRWVAENPGKYLFERILSNGKSRGAAVKMSYEDFLAEIGGGVPMECPVFGTPMDVSATWNSGNLATVDRIDSTRSYEPGNIAVISWRANALKKDGTAEEHRKIADWMDRMAARVTPPSST